MSDLVHDADKVQRCSLPLFSLLVHPRVDAEGRAWHHAFDAGTCAELGEFSDFVADLGRELLTQ